MKELPPKKELILRVELCSKQKEYYKAILTRNYQILTHQGGAHISLINVVMELRKLCCHPYMLQGVQPDLKDEKESYKQFLESSGKLQLLDKMMVKLKEQGHRVLIYSQFQHMLDLLEDYCVYKHWQYERIDGKVGGAERQVRIDRFNAKNSSRFCFILSTRAGGLGINLTTADTVIIYDSDWNPHADLQAMARAHRLGQTNKVMIYRLITRGTIEERMIQITKKKMVLEHLVVGSLKAQNINQEELDDIVRYGSKELFADENDEVGKSRLIHYDDEAIDRLLDRDQLGDEKAAVDGEDEDGFLKAFKVANFEYVEEVEPSEEVTQNRAKENQSSVTSSKRTNYWEELLKNAYEENKVEELNALGKGKRNRNKWLGGGFSGLEDVSSDDEDDSYKEDLTDDDSNSTETTTTRRPHKKKARDGVPKEGLRIKDILARIAVLLLIRDKVKFASENPRTRVFSDDILLRYAGLKGAKIWKEEHDLVLLHAVLKHGYGRWHDIVDDKDLKIQEVITQELNIPFTKLPVHGQVCSQVYNSANMTNVESSCNPSAETDKSDIADDGANMTNLQSSCNQSKESGVSNIAAEGAHGSGDSGNQAQFRDMQRRHIEFIKKRFLLLEKGLNAEYQKEYFSDLKVNEVENDEPKADIQMIGQLPRIEAIGSEEISISAYDCDPDRLQLVCLYNKMCKTVEENTMNLIQELSARELTEVNVIKNFHQLEIISADVNRILNQQNKCSAETQVLNSNKSNTLSQTEVVGSGLLSSSQDKCKAEDVVMVCEPKKESDQVTKISQYMGN
ncbi:hypothetical protein JHK85_048966 [Glycine max]|nr:hypothetical protein JHK85_048966 [Glycine max]